ncbi:6819_t:CDS:2, partial [Gigaspora rosea]
MPITMDLKAPNSKFSLTITKNQLEVIELSDTDDELILVSIQRQLSVLSCGSIKTDNSSSIFNISSCSNSPSVEAVDSFYKNSSEIMSYNNEDINSVVSDSLE